jgi:glyoxylase-like metal-dependent hydrolase (beta-lactamase superfamily II)
MQLEGGWGANHTALLVSKGESLLIDTTCDLPRMRRMLEAMRAADSAARHIGSIVLTHWHVDHVHGICESSVRESTVYASQACADWMANLPPKAWLAMVDSLEGTARESLMNAIGKDRFDFSGLTYRKPDQIFTDKVDLTVGDCKVQVLEMQPAHTLSDSIVHIPDEGTVHIGDLVTAGRHTGVQWPHPSNLIKACQTILSLGAETIIPGHGRMLRPTDIANTIEYMQFMLGKGRECYDRELTFEQAYDHIVRNLGPYKHLRGPQGIYFLCKMMYCEFSGDTRDHVRRNYPDYLETSYRLDKEVRQRFPELFAENGTPS